MIICFLLFLLSGSAFGHGESGSARVGKEYAVLEASDESGFRLSGKAISTIGLKVSTVDDSGKVFVPPSAIVKFKDHKALYRIRDSWIKRLKLADDFKSGMLTHKDLKPGDTVAIGGVPLLRVTELEVFGDEAQQIDHHHDHHDHGDHDHGDHDHG